MENFIQGMAAVDAFTELGPYQFDIVFSAVAPVQIVKPQDNKAGILLCHACLQPDTTTGDIVILMADMNAPTGTTPARDTSKRSILIAANGRVEQLMRPMRIKPEYGLWACASAFSQGARALGSYKLLQKWGGNR